MGLEPWPDPKTALVPTDASTLFLEFQESCLNQTASLLCLRYVTF